MKNRAIMDNLKSKRSHVEQRAKSMAKPNIHDSKVMLGIWCDRKSVMYYELIKLSEIINEERYRHELITHKL